MLVRTLVLSLLLAIVSAALYRLADQRSAQPDHHCAACNLVLVQIDTLRADHLGCYGHDRDTSPVLDALAASSLLFENAFSVAPWTFPAQFSIFTARYPHTDGLLKYYGGPLRFDTSFTTLAEFLHAAGYRTMGFHGGAFLSGGFGFERGFDTYTSRGRRFEDNLPEVMAFIGEAHERPFFLFLHGYNVHRPYQPPEHTRSRFVTQPPEACAGIDFADDDPRNERIRACLASAGGIDYARSLYDGEILFTDEILGRVFAEIAARDLAPRTVIVITSDHGEEFMEHGNLDHITHLFDELIRVPLVIHIPGGPTGRISRQVSTLQITPTVLDILRVEHDAAKFAARSLLAAEDPVASDRERSGKPLYALTAFTRFWAQARRPELQHNHSLAVIDGDLKYVLNWGGDGPPERLLLDRGTDPGERSNVIDQPEYLEEVERLEQALTTWREHEAVSIGAPGWEKPNLAPSPDVREQLRALGYAE